MLAVGWLWCCVTLLPVSGLIQTGAHAMADRFTHVPLVGIFIAAVWGIAELASRLENRRRWLVAVPACAVLILLCVLARAQVGYWKDSIRLFERALAVTERNGVAHDMLGASFLRLGRTGEAIPHFLAALAIHPNRATAHYNLGAAYCRPDRSTRRSPACGKPSVSGPITERPTATSALRCSSRASTSKPGVTFAWPWTRERPCRLIS